MTQDAEHVSVTVTGPVGRVTMTAVERLNAVDAPMLEALVAAVRRLDADPAVRVIALTGEGRGFCAGANLAIDRAALDSAAPVDSATLRVAGDLVRALLGASTPTVALVSGVAAGVGVSLALSCHYTLASDDASFTLAFTKIGLMPDGGATALVAAHAGRAKAMRMALTGERVDARTADAWGLVSECVSGDEFAARSEALLFQLAAGPPLAMAATTAAVNAGSLDLEAALAREEPGQQALLDSSDFREGVIAFLEKWRASFHGS